MLPDGTVRTVPESCRDFMQLSETKIGCSACMKKDDTEGTSTTLEYHDVFKIRFCEGFLKCGGCQMLVLFHLVFFSKRNVYY